MFDPTRAPPPPIPAASVVLVRDRPAGVEVLLVKRSGRSGFMASSFVFPGGKVDAGEALEQAAARELREEANVRVDAGALRFWARWITPSAEPKRFDATFFVAVLPDGEEARIDDHEAVELAWVTPAVGLARHAAGDPAFRLPPPQLWTLTELVAAGDTTAAIADAAAARAAHRHPVMPRFCEHAGSIALLLPWDPEYATRGLGQGDPTPADAPRGIAESRVVLDGQTWRLARP